LKKVLVALPENVANLLNTELVGKIGETCSDTLRTITMSWLSEKGYLTKGGKHAKE
jgi:hypothetical protein